jgi:phosphotransacetylase
MFPLEKIIDDQLKKIKESTPFLIFPESLDPRVIEAASALVGLATVIFVGDEYQVKQVIKDKDITLKISQTRFFESVVFVSPQNYPELSDEFSKELYSASRNKSWSMNIDTARELVKQPVYFAILAVRLGYANAVLGGLTMSSKDFFRPCLRLLEKSRTVYEMALFALPDSHVSDMFEKNLVMFADVALNPDPNHERLVDIAVGACKTMRNIIPETELKNINGAILSYSTRGSGEGPSVEKIRRAEPLIQKRLKQLAEDNPFYKSINIVTELQIGCAVSKEAAKTKLAEMADANPAIGASNVLIVPTLDSGNLLYHIYSTRYPDASCVLIIGGLKNQALDFSRNSKTEEIILGAKALMLRLVKSGRFKLTLKGTFIK